MLEEAIFVFGDDSHFRFQFTFVVTKDGVLGEKATFPGYEERWLYWCETLPESVEKELRVWMTQPGEVSRPWPKRYQLDGPWFLRVRLPLDESASGVEAYFANENEAMKAFLQALRDAVVREKNRIEAVPEWALEDARIKRWLGFGKGLPTDPEMFRPFSDEEKKWQLTLFRKMFRLRREAKEEAKRGEHLKAAVLFAQMAAARELLGMRFSKTKEPWSWEREALKEFEAAGKGEAYEQFLRAKYPEWKPEDTPPHEQGDSEEDAGPEGEPSASQ